MIDYSINPTKTLNAGNHEIASFVSANEDNIDWETVDSFGEEWEKFKSFTEAEIQRIGDDYFDLMNNHIVNKNTIALDVGCGSGRWARYLAPHVKFIEAVDPSAAVLSATVYLRDKGNVRVSQASVNNIPFADKSFDLVYSLGVLHHLPDTQLAIAKCTDKIKPGGWLLLYLYYALENRSFLYRLIFTISTVFRKIISSFPSKLKKIVCDIIAATVYLPLALLSRILSYASFLKKLADRIPLAYYRKTSFHVMRNDALDRFGTPLEKRFTKTEIEAMLKQCGLTKIQFSNKQPYWHVIAQRPA
jgi:ubiquinone/menaquinone biosynthesis C-methylase UbiE